MKRQDLSLAELVAFHAVLAPRLEEVFAYLDRFDQDALPEPEALLLRVVLGLTEVAQAVEIFRSTARAPRAVSACRENGLDRLPTSLTKERPCDVVGGFVMLDINQHMTKARDMDLEIGQAPVEYYTSPQYYKREQDMIFRRAWLMVGRVEEVAEPGDFVVRELPRWKRM
ncbi:MAG: hypothetical protein HC869_18900 [Rhodospirillales bacterium]|nr:hypothetical protein [Rhodospirillales bacterium]